jgi:hypothetical protein
VGTYVYAVRSDGSAVMSWTSKTPDGRLAAMKNIMDFTAKRRIRVNGTVESVATTVLTDALIADQRRRNVRCLESAGPKRKLLGFSVVELSSTIEAIRVESWEAPELACQPLFEEGRRTLPSGSQRRASKEAVAVQLGEPSPQLFAVPRWKERDPVGQSEEYQKRYGRELYPAALLARYQASYLAGRVK